MTLTAPEMMTVLVNLLGAGCSILLLQKGPTKLLRRLTLTVGIMSMSQVSSFLFAIGYWQSYGYPAAQLHQMLVGVLAVYASLLVLMESKHHHIAIRKLRLIEDELEAAKAAASRPIVVAKIVPAPERAAATSDEQAVPAASFVRESRLKLISPTSPSGEVLAMAFSATKPVFDKTAHRALAVEAHGLRRVCVAPVPMQSVAVAGR